MLVYHIESEQEVHRLAAERGFDPERSFGHRSGEPPIDPSTANAEHGALLENLRTVLRTPFVDFVGEKKPCPFCPPYCLPLDTNMADFVSYVK
jgi:hypothetical protein